MEYIQLKCQVNGYEKDIIEISYEKDSTGLINIYSSEGGYSSSIFINNKQATELRDFLNKYLQQDEK